MGTRTHVTYFSRDAADRLMSEADDLALDLARRSARISPDHYSEAWDRIEAVRLAVKRLSDICPD